MHFSTTQSPIRQFSGILPGGLALSIGWGIRGNFGHEYGAAFARCLTPIIGSILSGRANWRAKPNLKNAKHK